MTELTLLTKIYNSHQMKQIHLILEDLLGDLSVEAIVKGTEAGRWVHLEISGEDEGVATKLLEREVGFCPISIDKIKNFSDSKGFVTSLEKSNEALIMDLGVFQPKPVYAMVHVTNLQETLTEGKRLSVKKISDLWGFAENLPLKVKVIEANTEEGTMKAELQEIQVKKLLNWRDSLLDRLLIIGASASEVNAAVEHEGLGRDIIDVESLGLFEKALVCKLGTDAAGLIGRLGRHLRKARFTVFNPKNLQ